MKTAICPISEKRINENIARSNALITVILLIVYGLTSNLAVIGFLFFDFLLRGLEFSKFSLIAILSKKVNQLFNIQPEMINAGPKIFAARIGVVFSGVTLIATVLGWQTTALIFAGIFGFCALLEGFFAFCVACEIYPFVYKLLYKAKILSQ